MFEKVKGPGPVTERGLGSSAVRTAMVFVFFGYFFGALDDQKKSPPPPPPPPQKGGSARGVDRASLYQGLHHGTP